MTLVTKSCAADTWGPRALAPNGIGNRPLCAEGKATQKGRTVMNERGAGWAGLAAILFLVIGIWNVIEGVFGLARSSFWTSTGKDN